MQRQTRLPVPFFPIAGEAVREVHGSTLPTSSLISLSRPLPPSLPLLTPSPSLGSRLLSSPPPFFLSFSFLPPYVLFPSFSLLFLVLFCHFTLPLLSVPSLSHSLLLFTPSHQHPLTFYPLTASIPPSVPLSIPPSQPTVSPSLVLAGWAGRTSSHPFPSAGSSRPLLVPPAPVICLS